MRVTRAPKVLVSVGSWTRPRVLIVRRSSFTGVFPVRKSRLRFGFLGDYDVIMGGGKRGSWDCHVCVCVRVDAHEGFARAAPLKVRLVWSAIRAQVAIMLRSFCVPALPSRALLQATENSSYQSQLESVLSRETLRAPGVQITTCNPINDSKQHGVIQTEISRGSHMLQ